LIVTGNTSGDWGHQVDANQLWLGRATVAGFDADAYLPTHPHLVHPALQAAVAIVATELGETEIDVLPFTEAATANKRMETRDLSDRIVLAARS